MSAIDIHALLSAHRCLNDSIVRDHEAGRVSDEVFDKVVRCITKMDGRCLSEEEQNQVKEITGKKLASYSKLAESVRLLEKKIEHGQPLRGKCQLCLES